MTLETLLARRGCGWVVAVIPARPEGPVPEQERLRAAQILACFIAVDWSLPAAALGGSNLFLEQEGKSPNWLHTFPPKVGSGEKLCAL